MSNRCNRLFIIYVFKFIFFQDRHLDFLKRKYVNQIKAKESALFFLDLIFQYLDSPITMKRGKKGRVRKNEKPKERKIRGTETFFSLFYCLV